MNLKESPRRLWALIGVASAAVIVAATYLLLISGQQATQKDLQGQADAARQVAAVSQSKLRALQKDDVNLPQYKAKLAALQAALPKTTATARFVADMQSIAKQSSVTITSINVTPPITGQSGDSTKVAGATPLPITLATSGAATNLEKFLSLLQLKAPRAVLVGSVAETVPSGGGANNAPTMNIGMKAFFGRS